MELLQDIVLHQALIFMALMVVFLAISRWALVNLREYAAYGLGWMLGLFFVIVYVSLGGGQNNPAETTQYLGIVQVFIATFIGLFFGGLVQVGLRFGMKMTRALALQVALYTCLGIIVLFLVLVEGQIAQRMIGIFSLAVAIATLFSMVLFPAPKQPLHVLRQPIQGQQNPQQQQYPPETLGQGGGGAPLSRLDEIRQRQRANNGGQGRR